MATEIRVPQLGESVVEATIGRWLKKVGDSVRQDEPLVELETDKVNVEVPALSAGVLTEILRQEGDTVTINDVLAVVSASADAVASAPAPQPAVPASAPTTEDRKHASPLAANVAKVNGVDIAQVQGTGAGGKVMKDDVQAHLASNQPTPVAPAPVAPPPAPVAAPKPAAPAILDPRIERVPMSRRRRAIAANLVKAQHTAAMLTTFNEVDLTAVMEIRKRRKDAFKEKHGVNLGFMSFFTKAVVGALKQFPLLNAEIDGDDILIKKFYDIGIAVGVPEGLVVPILRDADQKTFAGIEKSIGDLASRARSNKLSIDELQGGTFTITNGGVYGSLMSTPILSYPQVGILGMHRIQERPMVVNGEIAIRPMMYIALSYDHRIVDGGDAVRFLVTVRDLLEDPEQMLLEG
jgi:2-oxoglutarate dehydrogenase E2 component (dihydrolipoamide succinyltransferase)